MGAWTFVAPRLSELLDAAGRTLRYVGRPDRASPAEGWAEAHASEQQRIISRRSSCRWSRRLSKPGI